MEDDTTRADRMALVDQLGTLLAALDEAEDDAAPEDARRKLRVLIAETEAELSKN